MTQVEPSHARSMTVAERAASGRRLKLLVRRFLVPSFVVTLVGFARWRAKISPRAEVELSPHLRLGRGTVIGSFAKFKVTDGPLHVGERCSFGTGCFLDPGTGGIRIGDGALIGPNVAIVAVNYRYDEPGRPLEEQGVISKGIRIGRHVWVGANASVVDGVTIGDDSIVVANSLVTRSFPAGSVIQGNPARLIFTRAGR